MTIPYVKMRGYWHKKTESSWQKPGRSNGIIPQVWGIKTSKQYVPYQELHRQKRFWICCPILMIVLQVSIHTGDKMEPAAPKQFGPSELVWKMRRHLHLKYFNFHFVTIINFSNIYYIRIFCQKASLIVKNNIQTKSWRWDCP